MTANLHSPFKSNLIPEVRKKLTKNSSIFDCVHAFDVIPLHNFQMKGKEGLR